MDGYKGRGDCVDPWRELSARAKNIVPEQAVIQS